jgi:mevalonate pyrophosphate decarboxylase
MERAKPTRGNGAVTCSAHPVQGIVCAHGYADSKLKTLPVETVFASIGALETIVRFSLLPGKAAPRVICNGRAVPASWANSVEQFVRIAQLQSTGERLSYAISIHQNFRSGIGVGSSAAIYAALARCLVRVFNLDLPDESAFARLGSYSAAAATVGGISVIRSGPGHSDNIAEAVCSANNFPFRILVLPVDGEKQSSDLHQDMPKSTYYDAWLAEARRVSQSVVASIRNHDWPSLASEVEHYLYTNFAAMSTGPRNLLPWRPTTLRRLSQLTEIRQEAKLPFFMSMNSGPAVFVYVRPRSLEALLSCLRKKRIPCLLSQVGGGARDVRGNARQR